MYNLQTIAERIKELCDKNNVSINKMLTDSGAGVRTYHNILSGSHPSADKISKIADYFNVSVDYLLGKKDDSEIYSHRYDIMPQKYIIGYIDLLGIKNKIKSENQCDILQTMHIVHSSITEALKEYKSISGPIKIKIFSDNILFALQYNNNTIMPDLLYMINVLMLIQSLLLRDRFHYFLLRGCICIGDLYIDDVFTCGSGLIDAYEIEDKIADFPRIVIEKTLAENFINFFEINKKENVFVEKDYDGEYYLNYLYYTKPEKLLMHQYVLLQNEICNQGNKRVLRKNNWAKLYHNRYCKKVGKLELMFKNVQFDTVYGTNNLVDDYVEDEFKVAHKKAENFEIEQKNKDIEF